jgi:hypothetical protein
MIYGVFVKRDGKYTGPAGGEIYSKSDVIFNTLIPESSPFDQHLRAFAKEMARELKRKVKIKKIKWVDV